MGLALGTPCSQAFLVQDAWSQPCRLWGCGRGLPGHSWLSLGDTLEAGGGGWFVDGVRCESRIFPPVVPSEVPVCEQAEGRAF